MVPYRPVVTMSPSPGERNSESSGHHGHPPDRPWTREDAVAALDDPDRARTLDPQAFWDHVQLKPGQSVVDVGSGTGFFALPAARMVGVQGHVYAVDISPELVELVAVRSRDEHLPQLASVESTPKNIPLPSAIADIVLLATVLHDVSSSTLAEAVRLLRPGGKLIDLDWKKEASGPGPPLEIRLSVSQATDLLSSHGLVVRETWEPGPYHYALIATRPPPS